MVLGPHHFLITELQLLKVSFFLSVSLRAETANLPVPLPSTLSQWPEKGSGIGLDLEGPTCTGMSASISASQLWALTPAEESGWESEKLPEL